MILLHALALISLFKIVYTEGSHSLWYFITLTSGKTPFPELVAVEMMDDFPVGYYDSEKKKVVAWKNWQKDEDEVQYQEIRRDIIKRTGEVMKERLELLRNHYNDKGLLTYQRLAGCELNADGTEGFKVLDAYKGTAAFNISDSDGWQSLIPGIEEKFQQLESKNGPFSETLYGPCILTLTIYLEQLKSLLNQKVHPTVIVMNKEDKDSGRMNVTCLATGFYPRHINMTLLRNDQPVPDQELTRGEPLPNEDGTYQLRRSLSVSAEEWRNNPRYTCNVTHSSIDNKLDMGPVIGRRRINPYAVSFGIILPALAIIIGCLIWNKKKDVFQCPKQ